MGIYRNAVFRNGEFATCSNEIAALKELKEQLRQADFPLDETRAAVRRFLHPETLAHLGGGKEPPVYLVAPSTSGTNLLPAIIASELKERFGGTIVQGWAFPQNVTRTILKAGIGRLRDPQRYDIADDVADRIAGAGRVVLVDDMVSTGLTQRALRESLQLRGVTVTDVVSLTQSEMRKVNDRDVERLVEKLGDPLLQPAIAAVLNGQLKHFANYVERILDRDGNERTAAEVRNYFTTEYARMQQLGLTHGGAERGIGDGTRAIEGAQRLAGPATDLSGGISTEARGVRGSEDRRADPRTDLNRLVAALEEKRNAWLKGNALDRANIVRDAEKLVMALPGSDVTRIPLKVAARDFVTGAIDKKALAHRSDEHARLLLTSNAITPARDRGRGGRGD